MATLTIEKDKAIQLYPGASSEMKEIFESTFGKKTFIRSVMDRIQSFDDACKELRLKSHGHAYEILKLDRKLLADVPIDECEDTTLMQMIIIKALNENWIPDYNDAYQRKWYPWFKWNGSAFVFSGSGCGNVFTITRCGSRLVLASEELSNYYGKKFIDLHNKILK